MTRTNVRTHTPGVCGGFEQVARVVLWMQQRHTAPTWRDVVARWGVDRATAYRWLAAWKAAQGSP